MHFQVKITLKNKCCHNTKCTSNVFGQPNPKPFVFFLKKKTNMDTYFLRIHYKIVVFMSNILL
jgi:hypothetical protein